MEDFAENVGKRVLRLTKVYTEMKSGNKMSQNLIKFSSLV